MRFLNKNQENSKNLGASSDLLPLLSKKNRNRTYNIKRTPKNEKILQTQNSMQNQTLSAPVRKLQFTTF
jgi:hypothetical protein